MNYQEFIAEVNKHRDTKLMYQYGERNKPENYLPKDPVKDTKKVKLAQVVDPLKSGAIGGRTTFYSGTLKDKEHRLKKLVGNLEKVGILHGGTKGSDLYDRLP